MSLKKRSGDYCIPSVWKVPPFWVNSHGGGGGGGGGDYG